MNVPPPALDELARLAALYACEILDTLPESAFEDLVELAQRVCGTSAAAISFIDSDRQWFKAGRGIEPGTSMPRTYAFCNYTIQGSGTLVIPDATADSRFRDNPYTTGEAGVRFYAGVPLTTSEGARVGTLCVLDSSPRSLEPAQQKMLEILARQIGAQLELRRKQAELQEALASRDEAVKRLGLVYSLQKCASESVDLEAAMASMIARIGETLDWSAGGVWLCPQGSGPLVNVGGYWTAHSELSAFREATLSVAFFREVGILGLAWSRARAVWLDNLVDEPALPRLTPALSARLATGVAVPVLVDGTVVAVFELFSAKGRKKDDDALALLAHAATELATLLKRKGRESQPLRTQ